MIDSSQRNRYIVQIEIQTVAEESSFDIEDEIDQLTELHQSLEGMGETAISQHETSGSSQCESYDLCDECHSQFSKNPLGRDFAATIGFSNN